MRNINEEEKEDVQKEAEETIEPESTCYIQEIMYEDLNCWLYNL